MKFFDKLKKNYELKKDKKQKNKEREKYHKEVLLDEKKNKSNKKIAPNDAYISLLHINKIYDNHVQAVFDFNLDIQKHEFIVFVGPSGCGKSTTLRMIAGLEDITAGDLFIDDKLVNDLEPKDRKVTMVFQNYALYPHMTVYENMSYGLKIAKVNKAEIDRRVHEAAKILDIEEYLQKKPKEMSGGQRQRVALGRAIVRNPKVFLLDEPLSNLDAKLRATMRTEISKLHNRLQTTFIYVTHDQTEAMTMGTRIVVMKKGLIQQIDTPKNLYTYPINKFVAGFIGTPQMNFFEGNIKLIDGEFKLNFSNNTLIIPSTTVEKMDAKYFDGRKITIGIRSEDLYYDDKLVENNPQLSIKVKAQVIEELGAETLVNANVIGTADNIIFKTKNTSTIVADQEVSIYVDPTKLHFFDLENENTLLPRIPKYRHFNLKVEDGAINLFDQKYVLPPYFKNILKENNIYEFKIPTEAIVKGNSYKGIIEKCEQIDDKYLAHIKINNYLIFAILDEEISEGSEFDFDVNSHLIQVREDGEVLINSIPDTNKVLGKLFRIKDEIIYTAKNGKEKKKKVTGFKYKIGDYLIDVDKAIYEKTLAVLVKKFELHDIEYSFSSNVDALTKDQGITVKFLKLMDYGKEKFAQFVIPNENNFDNKFIIKVSDDFNEKEDYKLKLKYEELGARDTHFDINLK